MYARGRYRAYPNDDFERVDADINFNSCAFTLSTPPLRDYTKRFAKASTQEPDSNPSIGGLPAETLFGPVAAMQNEWTRQVCIPSYFLTLILHYF